MLTRLADYIRKVGTVKEHDVWWECFQELADCLLDLPLSRNHSERHMHKSDVYTVIGNLVFQYKRDLHGPWRIPKLSLDLPVIDTLLAPPQKAFTLVITNGLAFHIYDAYTNNPGEPIDVRIVSGLNLSSPMLTAEEAITELRDLLYRIGNLVKTDNQRLT